MLKNLVFIVILYIICCILASCGSNPQKNAYSTFASAVSVNFI